MSHIVWLLGWGTRFDSQWGQELIITLLELCANPYTNTVVHTSHYISLPLSLSPLSLSLPLSLPLPLSPLLSDYTMVLRWQATQYLQRNTGQ